MGWPKDHREDSPFTTVAPRWVDPAEVYVKMLSLDGDESTFDMNVDASGSGGLMYQVIVPDGKVLLLRRLAFHLVDGKMEPHKFGDRAVLVNGCELHIHNADDSHAVRLISEDPIKTNADFAVMGVPYFYEGGVTNESLVVTIDFVVLCGCVLRLQAGMYMAWHTQDNLEALTHFQGSIGGRLVDA